jgi:hypothetical protein
MTPNTPLRVRAGDMRVIELCTLGMLAERCERLPLDRCDLWRHDDTGGATVGVTWADESFTLIDFRHDTEADQWIAASEALQACLEVHS